MEWTMLAPEAISTGREEDASRKRYWSGTVGSTWWFYFTGDSTDELWGAYIEHCLRMLESGMSKPSLVCIAHRADSPTSQQRRMIADFIRGEQARLSALVGFALVLDSPLHILALRAINWLVRKPFPETVCGSPTSAVMWLHDHGAAIDAQAFALSLAQHVPPEHLGAF
jgi:hypothetical protein